MEEIWIPIKDYEGFYEVSNLLRIRSVDRTVYRERGGNGHEVNLKGRILAIQYIGKLKTLLRVKLYKEGIEYPELLHELVHKHFDITLKQTPGIPEKPVVAISQKIEVKANPIREALEDAECILEYFEKVLDEAQAKTGKEQPMQQQTKNFLKLVKSLRYIKT